MKMLYFIISKYWEMIWNYLMSSIIKCIQQFRKRKENFQLVRDVGMASYFVVMTGCFPSGLGTRWGYLFLLLQFNIRLQVPVESIIRNMSNTRCSYYEDAKPSSFSKDVVYMESQREELKSHTGKPCNHDTELMVHSCTEQFQHKN